MHRQVHQLNQEPSGVRSYSTNISVWQLDAEHYDEMSMKNPFCLTTSHTESTARAIAAAPNRGGCSIRQQ